MARRSYRSTLFRLALVLVLAALAALALWLYAGRWMPSRAEYHMQGLTVTAASGAVEWRTVRARHADFAYIRATGGAGGRDPGFEGNWNGARQAGLRYGALHDFSLCAPASDQATLFMTTVPRDNAALPPAIRLAFDPGCPARPDRAALLSGLNIFLNLVEGHSGKPALLRLSKEFEATYDISSAINRTLWLEGNFLAPGYAARPWVMWTATDMLRLDGVEQPVEWDVVR